MSELVGAFTKVCDKKCFNVMRIIFLHCSARLFLLSPTSEVFYVLRNYHIQSHRETFALRTVYVNLTLVYIFETTSSIFICMAALIYNGRLKSEIYFQWQKWDTKTMVTN